MFASILAAQPAKLLTMNRQNYRIEYTCYSRSGAILKQATTIAKGALHGAHAQVRLDEHLRRTYPDFGRLVVHSCRVDLSDLFKGFTNRGKWPFL